MKRFCVILAAALVAASAASAQDAPAPAAPAPTPADMQAELNAALQDMSTAQLGTLAVGDIVKVASRISIAEQKVAYVHKALFASLMFPGAGQFMTGDALGGSLFLLGDLAIFAGALVGGYYALPHDLRFDQLNYFTTPISTINSDWELHTVLDYLPTAGILAGGMLLQGMLRYLSAANASRDARKEIADGKITFTPNFGFMGRNFGMGFGMRMRM